jgi:hypothetical protein
MCEPFASLHAAAAAVSVALGCHVQCECGAYYKSCSQLQPYTLSRQQASIQSDQLAWKQHPRTGSSTSSVPSTVLFLAGTFQAAALLLQPADAVHSLVVSPVDFVVHSMPFVLAVPAKQQSQKQQQCCHQSLHASVACEQVIAGYVAS